MPLLSINNNSLFFISHQYPKIIRMTTSSIFLSIATCSLNRTQFLIVTNHFGFWTKKTICHYKKKSCQLTVKQSKISVSVNSRIPLVKDLIKFYNKLNWDFLDIGNFCNFNTHKSNYMLIRVSGYNSLKHLTKLCSSINLLPVQMN